MPGGRYTVSDIQADMRIEVEFGRDIYTLTATAGTGGTIAPAGSMKVDSGENRSFLITPDAGYQIDKIKVDGVELDWRDSSYTFRNVDASHMLEVTFLCEETFAVLADAPEGVIGESDVTIKVSGESAGYKYSLDGGALSLRSDIGNPISLTALKDGKHVLKVYGVSGCETVQADPTRAEWVQDTSPPIASIMNPPSGVTNATMLEFRVGGHDVVKYAYKHEYAGNESDFTDEKAVTAAIVLGAQVGDDALAEGKHTLSVKGMDRAGNLQSEATTITWEVNRTSPAVTLINCPEGTTGATSIDVTVAGVGYYAYSLTKRNGDNGWEELDASHDTTRLFPAAKSIVGSEASSTGDAAYIFDDGETYRLVVTGVNAIGNRGEVTREWTVDTSVPMATLSNLPELVTNSTSASVRVGGDGVVSYKYKIDEEEWSEEREISAAIELSGLEDKGYTLFVSARGANESWQSLEQATQYSWTVDTKAPDALVFAEAEVTSTSVLLNWTVVDSVSYDIRYATENSQGWWEKATKIWSGDVTDGIEVDGLLPGKTYYFGIKAMDLAGNVSDVNNAQATTVNVLPSIAHVEFAGGGTSADNGEERYLEITGENFSGVDDVVRFTGNGPTFDLAALPGLIDASDDLGNYEC